MQNGPLRLPRSLPLPALLGAIFGIVPMHLAQAATLLVTDCGDGVDSGTLRNTVAVAPDNSTIQIPLTCSSITIAGDIFIPNTISNMTIAGQGASVTTIDANRAGRAFYSFHTGGDLEFKDLTIANGYYSGAPVPLGGCIYGVGNVVISNAVIADTQTTASAMPATTASPRPTRVRPTLTVTARATPATTVRTWATRVRPTPTATPSVIPAIGAR